ncbi:lysine exporter LysO family protein [Taylorella equigenitalis]|uniref:lysine exporter LysO family protein n=1 Tax=Taylorella equigenitalis TaxID=29575 RepID=UPI00237CA364|nr:lysine exporter LysO family protein [Taylorella equigenitalis]WDU54877.1 lysine exporter LysO family protein [Taylorella equigenitalis]
MTHLIQTISPLFLAIAMGVFVGRTVPSKFTKPAVLKLGVLVWILLFAIGWEFGLVYEQLSNPSAIIKNALIFSLSVSLGIATLMAIIYKQKPATSKKDTREDIKFSHIILEVVLALASVSAGLTFSISLVSNGISANWMPAPMVFLYIMLFLIGVDITFSPLKIRQLKKKVLLMPIVITTISLITGVITAQILGLSWKDGLLFSCGFGWFSLSGTMVAGQIGEVYGATMLLTDLFRELLSIFVIFFIGHKYPDSAIATAGGTAMDTTLPIIRKTCGFEYTLQGLYIGIAFTLITPFLLTAILSSY